MVEVAVPSESAEEASPPNSLFVSPALRVAVIPGKGRGLMAKSWIPRGTLIIQEQALASSLKHMDGFCDHCGLHAPELPLRCGMCETRFCGSECAKEAERLYHWFECGKGRELIGDEEELFRLALRLFLATPPHLRHLWSFPHPFTSQQWNGTHPTRSEVKEKDRRLELGENDDLGELIGDELVCWTLSASLPRHKKETKDMADYDDVMSRLKSLAGLLCGRAVSSSPLCTLASLGVQKIEMKTLRCLAGAMMVTYSNTFNVYRRCHRPQDRTIEDEDTGSVLYPVASLLNHSCLPNTTRSFLGRLMLVRVIRDIPPGTEITTTYGVDVKKQPTIARRYALTNVPFLPLWLSPLFLPDLPLLPSLTPGVGGSGASSASARRRAGTGSGGGGRPSTAASSAPSATSASPSPSPTDGPRNKPTRSRLPRVVGGSREVQWCEDRSLSEERVVGSLKVRCLDCGLEGTIAPAAIQGVLRVMGVMKRRLPFQSDLLSLVTVLHPANNFRLLATWTVELFRSRAQGYLDGAAVTALGNVHGNLVALLRGPYDIDVADDALGALRVLDVACPTKSPLSLSPHLVPTSKLPVLTDRPALPPAIPVG